ncbi:hypothetical protein [Varunaivibrio sulfuroxidans]|uniref:DUF3311 domain-containing protein n=1 Tax=Varunaivibrio sulfuroxidans TaxID=1773489 RepID=A0A4R3J8M4_9PROT|nr:hypothetical protein [Varunaivibrio sulfuroxidans]TCS61276.1 hypothetical protein EDD55_10875 [Varunaivibrio sulfuroxidans]WES31106.1 hypothetical protein P3M64_01640 [Varunaivibrio sulfuroxidans]
MIRTHRKKESSIVLLCFFLLIFFPPILGIYNREFLIGGMPVAYLTLYGAWLALIVLIAIGARRQIDPTAPVSNRDTSSPPPPSVDS